MAYGIYRGNKVRKIRGSPRSPGNQRRLIVWDTTKKGLKSWVRKWGSKSLKKKVL